MLAPLAHPEVSLTERRRHFGRVFAALAALVTMHVARTVWAQGAVRDQSGTLTASPTDDANKDWLRQRFSGSFAEVDTYVGSGSFYTSGYRDPYVANSFYLRPTFQLGTRYNLTVNARVYVEKEYTLPDNPNARSWTPYDSWLFLTAKNLYTMPRAKVKFSGTLRAVFPTSFESRYAHLVTALGAHGVASRGWELGRPDAQGKRWQLIATLGTGVTKAIRTSALRGEFPGDTSGCRTAGPTGYAGAAGAADTDRCGGPLSMSWGVSTSGTIALSRGRYSLSTTLIVINEFKYSIDPQTAEMIVQNTNTNVVTGRSDITWGLIALGYDLTDHFSLSLGIASMQPALDSRYRYLRFPFFDFSGPNANNFTQVFFGVTGTL
jgi:hypothetical protein